VGARQRCRRASGGRSRRARRSRTRPPGARRSAGRARRRPPRTLEPVGREAEVADRVAAVGVESERHDEQLGAERRDLGARRRQRCEVRVVVGPFRQRVVRRRPGPGTGAGLVPMPGEVRVGPLRVTVQRDELDVVALVEDLLRAVAVVVVDVEHGDLAAGRGREVVRHDRGVVEEAVAAVERVGSRGARVVGTARTRPGPRRARGGRGQGDVDRRPGGVVGALRERGGGLVAPPAEPGADRGRLAGGFHPLAQSRHREHVGHHVVGRPFALVQLPRRLEELDETGVVHRFDRAGPQSSGATNSNASSAASAARMISARPGCSNGSNLRAGVVVRCRSVYTTFTAAASGPCPILAPPSQPRKIPRR
jgi:hypothetical protein